jgi:hypothetical protein
MSVDKIDHMTGYDEQFDVVTEKKEVVTESK